MNSSFSRRVAAEFIGTGFLVAAIVGSGIMGERLSGGNAAIALLANTLATGAALATLIFVFLPISGAHLNPVVSVTGALRRGITWRDACFYIAAQISGGILGTACANLMFALPVVSISRHVRTGAPQWFSEFIATFGLLITIRICARFAPGGLAFAVAGHIVAAYWFTASTSFANPAVTIARSLSDTFSGIRPADVPAFLAAEITGGLAATVVSGWLSFQSGDV